MGDRVRSETRDGIAVIRILNPPLSALTLSTIEQLHSAAETALGEADALVIAGAEARFAIGAVVEGREIETTAALSALAEHLESSERPVVAAIGGPALGGGLELALAAHARVAGGAARFGFPDVTIGLAPGAGGTQRLPRLVGGTAALRLLLSGRSIGAEAALRLGLVDEAVEGDPVEAAVALARRLTAEAAPLPRTRDRRDRLGGGTAFLEAVAEQRRLAERSSLEAPTRIVECVEAALLLPFEVGRGLEEAAYEDLVRSEQTLALRHLGRAERRLRMRTAGQTTSPSRPLDIIGVAGLARGGAALAMACLDAGFEVIAAERNDETLESGVARIMEAFDNRVAAGQLTEDAAEQTLERLRTVAGYRALSAADIVVSTAARPSRRLIEELDSVMKAGAVLAVAAETAPPGAIAETTSRPSDVLGLHLHSGSGRARFAEIAPAPGSGEPALASLRALARRLDLLVVEAGPASTGIAPALIDALHCAADACHADGAGIALIDRTLAGLGITGGSFASRDAEGLEHRARRHPDGPEARLIAAGRGGRRSGKGFYVYPKGPRGAGAEDAGLREILPAGSRRAPGETEIRARCLAALAGAGARLLASGAALHAADIDVVSVYGLGLARRTGGAMCAAERIGLAEIVARLDDLHARHPRIAAPTDALRALARDGRGFDVGTGGS